MDFFSLCEDEKRDLVEVWLFNTVMQKVQVFSLNVGLIHGKSRVVLEFGGQWKTDSRGSED